MSIRPMVRAMTRPMVRGMVRGGAADPISILGAKLAAWYTSDPSTLFTTSTGETPGTAAGEPVGLRVNRVSGGPDASQATPTARPLWQTGPSRIVYGSGDSMVATFSAAVGADCTVARAVPGTGADILTGQNITTTFTDSVTNCELVIANEALTAGETAALTAYLNQTRFGVAIAGQDDELLAGQDGFTLIQEMA